MSCETCHGELVAGRCPACEAETAKATATLVDAQATVAEVPKSKASAMAAPRATQVDGGAAAPASAPSAGHDALVGQVVNERFRITGFLGEGAMGMVYQAKQLGLGRDVAIKFIHRQLISDDARRARFEREAQILSKFEHPGIVAIYDYGEWDGRTYIAMQYLLGESLEALIEKEAPLPLAEMARIVSEICDALDAAHAAGIVHRDLKPENVMLVGPQRQVRLVDFGVAKLVDSAEKLTQEGSVIGTPGYMAPEQCAGDPVGPQTDVYALGVMLYEMLAQRLPFEAGTLQGLLLKHMIETPVRPSAAAPQLHPALDDVTLWALMKSRDARPQTAGEFKARLLDAVAQAEGRASDGHRRKDALYATDRAERSKAVGDAAVAAKAPAVVEGAVIAVEVEGAALSGESPATHLQLAGYQVSRAAGLEAIAPAGEKAIVVDLGPDPAAGLRQLEALLSAGKLHGLPVVVVGPDSAMDQMARALELELAAYVPRSKLQKQLAKSVRRAMRRG